MREPLNVTRLARLLAATAIFAACSDAVSPKRDLPATGPAFAVQDPPPALDQRNGTLGFNGSMDIRKGFNPTNPHVGDAIIATFMWQGPNTITSVGDHLTNGTAVGNTYTLVEQVTLGGLSMATYVATNATNFPDPNATQDDILVVQADFSSPVTEGGVMISSYTGVEPVSAPAIGGHHSASGTASSTTTAAPGPINAGAGTLLYTVTVSNNTGAHSEPTGYAQITNMSNNAEKTVGAWAVQGNAGTADPQWTWFYTSPGTWLATVLALNPAAGAPAPPGNLTVTTSTTGSNVDPDGYTVSVDGGASQAIGVNGSATFNGLAAGSHGVALSGVAANCSVGGANPQTATVPSGGTATSAFSVTCTVTSGDLSVTASTTGPDPDPDGYLATVDGSNSQAIATNGSVTFTGLGAGSHSVSLSGVASNCTVNGANPQIVSVPAGGTGTTTFSVSCVKKTGNLAVTTSTTGVSLDLDGYTVTVDGSQSQAIATNGSVTFIGLGAGSHSVALWGVAPNCTVTSANPQVVTVPFGGTASTTFAVSCVPGPATQLAFTVQPGTTLPYTTITPAVQITGLDAQGNRATSFGGSVTIAIGHNGGVLFPGTLSGTKTVAAVNGVATFSSLSIDQLGNGYTLVVNSSGLAGATSVPFTIGAF